MMAGDSDIEEDFHTASSDEESPYCGQLKNIDMMLGFLRAYKPITKVKTRSINPSQEVLDPIQNIVKCLENVKEVVDKMAVNLGSLVKENSELKKEVNALKVAYNRTYATITANSAAPAAPSQTQETSEPLSRNTRSGIEAVSKRLENLEQESYSKMIIVQGHSVQTLLNEHNSSRADVNPTNATTAGNVQPQSLKQKVSQMLINIGDINVNQTEDITVHPLGKDKKSLKITFGNEVMKRKCIREIKVNRPNGIFASEFLTKTRSGLLYSLRNLKKSHPNKLKRVYTIDGVVYYKMEGSDRGAVVRDVSDIDKLKEKLETQND